MSKQSYLAMVMVALLGTSLPASCLAEAQCADECLLGEVAGSAECRLWDDTRGEWIEPIDDGPGQLHNRARAYLPWLRELLMPAGGVMAADFTDASYQSISGYSGWRDPAIWTGAYLGAEALRYMSTGAPDAEAQLGATLQVLHRWWNIPGDPGYLARFAAPVDSTPEILATLPGSDDEVHLNTPYAGQLWNWRSAISRDQYQGVLLGYSLAYEATSDLTLRELIRQDVVEFAEQLMRREERDVVLLIGGQRLELQMELENVVYSTSDMPDGVPTVEVDPDTQEVHGRGIQVFWPNPAEFLRQIPGLWWLPDVELRSQAIQLASIFAVALQVSEGVAGYEPRHQALAAYYAEHFEHWLDLAARWENTNDCGDSYHGLNIAFMPLFNWARVETDPLRRERIQRDVLQSRLWPAVAEHKNVFFAFIYASQAPAGSDIDAIVSAHAAQLAGFPLAPNAAVAVDLRALYPEDPACPGQSATAIDVGQRAPATFQWERQPWKLQDPGVPNRLYGGVDYLLAYWLGRYFDFIGEDAPGTCLRYEAPGHGGPSAAHIGVYYPDSGWWYLDASGDGYWTEGSDRASAFGGGAGSRAVAGDWNGDGFDEIGVYYADAGWWYLDANADGYWSEGFDKASAFGGGAGSYPVAGDWNGDGVDEIGVYYADVGWWYLDTNADGYWSEGIDKAFAFGGGAGSYPVAGDWNGDGVDEIGVYYADTGWWYLDVNGDGYWTTGVDWASAFGGGAGSYPVAGDWNGDSVDAIGVYYAGTGGWYLDADGDGSWSAASDLASLFGGGANSLPVAGDWSDGSD
jgi:hypothetical protein